MKYMKLWYFFIQNFLRLVSVPVLKLIYDIEIYGKENIRSLPNNLIIASNHISLADSFFIAMPLPAFSNSFPLRFMTEDVKLDNKLVKFLHKCRILKVIYAFGGAFPSRRGRGIDEAIKYPISLLKSGATIVMFPEGGISNSGNFLMFRRGTAALSIKSNCQILPIYLEKHGRTIKIVIGKLFYPVSSDFDKATAQLKENVETLKNMLVSVIDNKVSQHGQALL